MVNILAYSLSKFSNTSSYTIEKSLNDPPEVNLGDTFSPKERREIAKHTTVIEPIHEDQFLCCFSHIFAGGYSAGYYSYKWAEVLSADAFSMFEEADLENSEDLKLIGKRFKDTILSLGGSLPPLDIFKLFRGREPQTDSLVRHLGLSGSK